MTGERVVHQFPAPNVFRTRLVAVDVTDSAIPVHYEYRLIRDSAFGRDAVLHKLTRDQLWNLSQAIRRELDEL
jgi:hypothetical protein